MEPVTPSNPSDPTTSVVINKDHTMQPTGSEAGSVPIPSGVSSGQQNASNPPPNRRSSASDYRQSGDIGEFDLGGGGGGEDDDGSGNDDDKQDEDTDEDYDKKSETDEDETDSDTDDNASVLEDGKKASNPDADTRKTIRFKKKIIDTVELPSGKDVEYFHEIPRLAKTVPRDKNQIPRSLRRKWRRGVRLLGTALSGRETGRSLDKEDKKVFYSECAKGLKSARDGDQISVKNPHSFEDHCSRELRNLADLVASAKWRKKVDSNLRRRMLLSLNLPSAHEKRIYFGKNDPERISDEAWNALQTKREKRAENQKEKKDGTAKPKGSTSQNPGAAAGNSTPQTGGKRKKPRQTLSPHKKQSISLGQSTSGQSPQQTIGHILSQMQALSDSLINDSNATQTPNSSAQVIQYEGRADHHQVFDIEDLIHDPIRGVEDADEAYDWNSPLSSQQFATEARDTMNYLITSEEMNLVDRQWVYDIALDYYRTDGTDEDLEVMRQFLADVHIAHRVDPGRMTRSEVLDELQRYINEARPARRTSKQPQTEE